MMWILNSLNLWQWALMLAIPPAVVLLYFLKLKRQPLEVPSTYLWHRTIEDLHVNSIWQKLRQNLLLFLQLLLLLLAILSILRPSFEGSKMIGERYIFLVDTSSSMAATDVEPTRLEAVKQQLEEMVDELQPGAVAMVVSFSDRAIVHQPFTDNRRLLKSKIRAIQQTNRPTIMDEALRVAAGLANPGRSATEEGDVASADAQPATLMIFTDGRMRVEPKFAMGNLEPVYMPIGNPQARNLGITAFNTAVEPGMEGAAQAYAQINNFSAEDTKATVDLYLDGKLIDAASVNLPANESRGVEFKIATSAKSGELRLQIQQEDAYAADNVAFAAINRPRKAQTLLITPRNDALETLLATDFALELADVRKAGPEYLKDENYKKLADSGAYDLIIYDQCVPESMPQANTFFLGAHPRTWQAEPKQQLPQVIDADTAHPLLQFVNFGNVTIVDCTPIQPPKGGSVLVDSQHGPLLAIGPRDGFEDLALGFELVGTNDAGERVR